MITPVESIKFPINSPKISINKKNTLKINFNCKMIPSLLLKNHQKFIDLARLLEITILSILRD